MSEVDRNSVKEAIVKILSNRLVIDLDKINEDSGLANELGLDSFGTVEIMFEIEDKFGIEIPEKDLVEVKTVKDILDYIVRRLKEKN
ncbi:MAG: acyl carrier protein [Candidatus Omnitrophica bacterium]|nr:acyl carrier protein [Candidatus Omnitrophota bacterium]